MVITKLTFRSRTVYDFTNKTCTDFQNFELNKSIYNNTNQGIPRMYVDSPAYITVNVISFLLKILMSNLLITVKSYY